MTNTSLSDACFLYGFLIFLYVFLSFPKDLYKHKLMWCLCFVQIFILWQRLECLSHINIADHSIYTCAESTDNGIRKNLSHLQSTRVKPIVLKRHFGFQINYVKMTQDKRLGIMNTKYEITVQTKTHKTLISFNN